MAKFELEQNALVAVARPVVSARGTSLSGFVSQLIAARDHLAPQRRVFRAPPGEAIAAYADRADKTIRRVPAGYRHSRSV